MLDAQAAEELRTHPLSDEEREMFVGQWLFARSKDQILVEITRTEDNEFNFRTTVLSAPATAAGRVTDEKAAMKGRLLLVEEPPNYRLYKVGDGGQKLILAGNELFTFTRRQ